MYGRFAKHRGLTPMNCKKLAKMSNENSLYLIEITHKNIIIHSILYLIMNEKARLLYTFTNEQEDFKGPMRGWASRLAMFESIQHLSGLGKMIDLGGASHATQKKRNITSQKESFSKNYALYFHGLEGITIRGKLAVIVLNLLKRGRTFKQFLTSS